MKHQVLFALCALLAAHVSFAAVEPVELAEPDQITESSEEIHHLSVVGRSANSLPFRRIVSRPASSNTIQTQRVTYTGRAQTRISSWGRVQVGVNQGEVAVVVAGGVGRNSITIEIRSQRGRGFNVEVQVFGTF